MLAATLALSAEAAPPPVEGLRELHTGDPAPEFSLPGIDGKTYTLADFKDAGILVVAFISNHCPASQAAEGRLKRFVSDLQPRGGYEGETFDELRCASIGSSSSASRSSRSATRIPTSARSCASCRARSARSRPRCARSPTNGRATASTRTSVAWPSSAASKRRTAVCSACSITSAWVRRVAPASRMPAATTDRPRSATIILHAPSRPLGAPKRYVRSKWTRRIVVAGAGER
ncbi:MAG: redoxin domain-containing protein [Bdellovibrionaceae bacterium]|nr:redoxin domain-containing protein [Pseudobdellovibrionaceae bacterium]